MHPPGLESYFELKHQDFLESFQNCVLRCSEEDIHDLRVSIKKIRAMISFLVHNEHRKTEMTILLKPIFRTAGKIRDIHIHQSIARSLRNRNGRVLLGILSGQIIQADGDLKLVLGNFDHYAFNRSRIEIQELIGKITEEELFFESMAFLDKKLVMVHEYCDKSFDSKLHRIRKEIKIIAEILKLRLSIQDSRYEQEIYSRVKLLSDHIGRWHDLDEFMKLVMKFREMHSARSFGEIRHAI